MHVRVEPAALEDDRGLLLAQRLARPVDAEIRRRLGVTLLEKVQVEVESFLESWLVDGAGFLVRAEKAAAVGVDESKDPIQARAQAVGGDALGLERRPYRRHLLERGRRLHAGGAENV